jgi:hypothetical protein
LKGLTLANAAAIKLGASSTLCVYTLKATDLSIDVTGIYKNS